MNIAIRVAGILLGILPFLALGAPAALACSPEDGCIECETGTVSACFKAEAARDAIDLSSGKYTRKSSIAQVRGGTGGAASDCARCQSYAGDNATTKAFCAAYLASGICAP
jgi:hypothetical protein